MDLRSSMRWLLLPVLAALAASFAGAADNTIYRSRDAQGNVVFSDSQDEAAEVVRLPQTNTVPMTAEPADTPQVGQDGDIAPSEPVGYETLAITTPHNGETIAHPTGYVKVAITVDPPLLPRHSLRLLLDGEPAGIPQQGSMELSGLPRGKHTLQLRVADDDGNVIQESAPITIQMLRPGRGGGMAPLPPELRRR